MILFLMNLLSGLPSYAQPQFTNKHNKSSHTLKN